MPDTDTDLVPEEDDDDDGKLECSECGKEITEEDDMSSFCGSICEECVPKHAQQCGVCRGDFLSRGLISDAADEQEQPTETPQQP